MNLVNCPRCDKLFVSAGNPICPACVEKEEAMFEKVRTFIKKNPGSSMQEVSERTEVPLEKILVYLREGRISGTALNFGASLQCLSCGKPIVAGRLCESCTKELGREMQDARTKRTAERDNDWRSKNKMHTRE